jgi:hypothetical protein
MIIAGQSILLEDLRTSWDGDPVSGAGTSQFKTRNASTFRARCSKTTTTPSPWPGYTELELAVEGTTTSTLSDDAFGFDLELRLDGRDVGSLIIDLGADGIPLALFGAFELPRRTRHAASVR